MPTHCCLRGPHGHRLGALLLLLLSSLATAGDPDPRQAYREGHSPDWLRAVGRLEVPGIRYEEGRRQHHTERCSATLVTARPGRAADTIVTAWHCLEYYEDLSQRIRFELSGSDGDSLRYEARRLAAGGSMAADWAILRLDRPVRQNQVPALTASTGGAGEDQSLLMAGFSRDPGPGQRGARLSYDPKCRITARAPGYRDSDCRAYRGASGGAVIEVSENGKPRLSGVISQGDGSTLSRFIPLAVFAGELTRHLGRVASATAVSAPQ